ncbi:myomegalin-like isoform X2 [Notamacropus eugenii]|uniref:myomegalin-like isoform X2 n=1 Tax=Notamacropus eugenii TaxID=9315 RepID=UPI003B67A492
MAVSLLSSLYVKEALEKSVGSQDTQYSNLTPPYPSRGDKSHDFEEEIICPKAEIHQLLEQKRKAEGELKDLKAQLEEAGFSSVSHIRNTLLSVYLENVELKEQMGEAMSEGWEMEEDKKKEEEWWVENARGPFKEGSQCAEVRKVQGKLQNANTMISLLRDQLTLNSKGGGKKLKAQLIISLTKEIDRLKMEVIWTPRDPSALAEQLQDRVSKGLYSGPQIIDLVSILDLKRKDDNQVNSQGLISSNMKLEQSSLQESTHHLHSQLEQYEQGYQDLQEKLLVSEATVQTQASQLEQYQALFRERGMRKESKEVQVDLQDLGYETCGRTENEAERKAITSPGTAVDENTKDASTESTDSVEEAVSHSNNQEQYIKEALESSMATQDTQHSNLTPPPPTRGDKIHDPEEELFCPEAEIHQLLEQKRKVEGELKDLKAQLEEAGFSSVSHIRNTLLSLYMENAELKEQMGEAMSEGWEMEEDKEKEEEWWVEDAREALKEDGQCAEVRKVQRKLQNANSMISLLREQLALNSQEGGKELNAQLIIGLAKEIDRLKTEVVWSPRDPSALGQQLQDRGSKGLYSGHQITDVVSVVDVKCKDDQHVNSQGLLSSNVSLEQSPLQGSTHHLRSHLERCKQGYQDLQEKLLVSEATVLMQASQLEQYQALFREPGVKKESKQVQVDLQDLGYETYGGRENENKEEETTSTEKLPSCFNEVWQSDTMGVFSSPERQARKVQENLIERVSLLEAELPKSQVEGKVAVELKSATWPRLSQDLEEEEEVIEVLQSQHIARSLTPSSSHTLTEAHRPPSRVSLLSFEMETSSDEDLPSCSSSIPIPSLESVSQLGKEIRILMAQKGNLQTQLKHLSQEHCRELQHLREDVLASHSRLQDVEATLEVQKAEWWLLTEDLKERQQVIMQLREEQHSLQEENSRLQHKIILFQQQGEENQRVLQSLQSELQIYLTLYQNSKEMLKACRRDMYQQGTLRRDLNTLVAEVQALRGQLQYSLQANNSLRKELEQKLESSPGKPILSSSLMIQDCQATSPKNEWKFFQELGFDVSPRKETHSMLKGDAPDHSLDNHGHHMIGNMEDFSALKLQISEGKELAHKMLSLLPGILNSPALQDTEVLTSGNIQQLQDNAKILDQILEESHAHLTMFWKAALPSTNGPTCQMKTESIEGDILLLKRKLLQQHNVLRTTSERLNRTELEKENLEKFIFHQLTRTKEVLKKARRNLEIEKHGIVAAS